MNDEELIKMIPSNINKFNFQETVDRRFIINLIYAVKKWYELNHSIPYRYANYTKVVKFVATEIDKHYRDKYDNRRITK